MKVWRESTSTSGGSKLHLSHHKSLVHEIKKKEGEELSSVQTEIEVMRKEMPQAQVAMMNLCIRNRCVLDRWKDVINLII